MRSKQAKGSYRGQGQPGFEYQHGMPTCTSPSKFYHQETIRPDFTLKQTVQSCPNQSCHVAQSGTLSFTPCCGTPQYGMPYFNESSGIGTFGYNSSIQATQNPMLHHQGIGNGGNASHAAHQKNTSSQMETSLSDLNSYSSSNPPNPASIPQSSSSSSGENQQTTIPEHNDIIPHFSSRDFVLPRVAGETVEV